MKLCFKCGLRLNLSRFYKHSSMADGHLGKCKDCAKADALAHRAKNLEKIRAYDRNRPNHVDRVAGSSARLKAKGGEYKKKMMRRYHEKYPLKRAAHIAFHNALRDKKVFRKPCIVCGKKAEAHHEDYSKPLKVVWLCGEHHREEHKRLRGSF